ncbi:MAG TPA: TIM-barrel domain-containing protein, partial [Gemmatimonadaceae bacterium]|nr:TIM-barrel domain-containing protein [Gemmatimonadaceae bacterium]
MSDSISRRDAVKRLGAAGVGALVGARLHRLAPPGFRVAGHDAEVLVSTVSDDTVRIIVRPIAPGAPRVADTGALARDPVGRVVGDMRDAALPWRVRAGNLTVDVSDGPRAVRVFDTSGALVQALGLDADSPEVTFSLGTGPILGMGEGGPQFDRRGSKDPMINGQGGYQLATHGTRAPIQWLIGTEGWALFIHQPYGAFDLTGERGVFAPAHGDALPLDVFVVASRDPQTIMREYARITGFVELPPRWALGYQQSHRTLAGREEVMAIARTMREKRLPCDTLIYLGTDFCPAGWNTHNGEFTWHPVNFPDPGPMIEALHAEHFKVVLHVVLEGRTLTGRVGDPCTAPPLPSGRTRDG